MKGRHDRKDVLLRIAAIVGLSVIFLVFTTLANADGISTANRTPGDKTVALNSPLTLSWSPDGKKIAVGEKQGGQIYTVDFQNTTELELEGDEQRINSIAWSPDGRKLAGAVDNNIWLWDANTGKQIALLRGITSVIASLAWKPDGRALAAGATGLGTGGNDQEIRIWRTDNYQVLKILKDKGFEQILTVSWSPDGQRIVDNSPPLGVRIWDANTSQILFNLRKGSDVSYAAWSPVGDFVAIAGVSGPQDLGTRIWDLQLWDGATGKLLSTFGDNLADFMTVKWSPDGTQLATANDRDGTVTIWDVATKLSIVQFTGNDFDFGTAIIVDFLTWSPDGQRVAIVTGDSHLRIWDVRSKTLVTDFSQ